MAFNITENLKQGLKANQITPVMVLELEGYDTLLGNVTIKKFLKIGDPGLLIGGGWVIGGFSLIDDQSPYILMNSGTTSKITQKLNPSRAEGSTVTSMVVSLLDHNDEITNLVSPGQVLEDIIGRKATVYLGIQDSAWPEDYNVVFRGVVQNVSAGLGFVNLALNSTEEQKRSSILPELNAKVTSQFNYRAVVFQDIYYSNRIDVTNAVSITYTGGGTAGSEIVTVIGTAISVQIQSGVSTAAQIKKAVENNSSANQLVDTKIQGTSSNVQVTGTANLSSDTTLSVDDNSLFIVPNADTSLTTYLKIEDELVQYTGIASDTFTGCTRASNASIGDTHKLDADVSQVIRLTGNGIDLALKLMLSQGDTYYQSTVPVLSFVYYSGSTSSANTIFFDGVDIEKKYGVCAGDTLDVISSAIPGNNATGVLIEEVGTIQNNSYVVTNFNFTSESSTPATVSFKSQFNTLPIGLGMLPAEVDVKQHLFIRDTFLPLIELDLFTTSIENTKSFLETELYLPLTCFSIPRKGRSSVAYHIGPLPNYDVVTADITNVESAENLVVQRSLSENFFNKVVYNYDFDPISGDYKTTSIFSSTISPTKIPIGDRPFTITSKGLRTSSDGFNIASRAAGRFLKRYELGAEFIKGVKIAFKDSYQTEIADVIAVDYASLKLSDFKTGTRSGAIRLMEILNKTLDNKTGEVSVDLVNTIFQRNDRFGLISPSTLVGTGSTTTKIIMQQAFTTKSFIRESVKWSGYVGQQVLVHSEDWSAQYLTTILGFDNNTPQGMLVDTLPTAPSSGWIVCCPNYPATTDPNDLAFWKQRHAFFSPQIAVVSAASQTVFTVTAGRGSEFYVGGSVRVHNESYTDDAPEALVTNISTDTITIDTATGFAITASHLVDLIGFKDSQPAYRIV